MGTGGEQRPETPVGGTPSGSAGFPKEGWKKTDLAKRLDGGGGRRLEARGYMEWGEQSMWGVELGQGGKHG